MIMALVQMNLSIIYSIKERPPLGIISLGQAVKLGRLQFKIDFSFEKKGTISQQTINQEESVKSIL